MAELWLWFWLYVMLVVRGKGGHFSCVYKMRICNFVCVWDFFPVFAYGTEGLLGVILSWARPQNGQNHTYLARETPWSSRRFSVGEAFPLHFGRVDPADHLKCRWLECVIYWWGGLRSRYPLLKWRKWVTWNLEWCSCVGLYHLLLFVIGLVLYCYHIAYGIV